MDKKPENVSLYNFSKMAKTNDEGPDLELILKKCMPDLQQMLAVYKFIHQNPELPGQESTTAEIVNDHLQILGFSVRKNIAGHGVVGVYENGPGRTIMLRAEMDARAVLENTGLPYSSTVRAKDRTGKETPVMHACGHDMHVTCLLTAARLLVRAERTWSGTLICLFQGNDEDGTGSIAMAEDGLWNNIPGPDIILDQRISTMRIGDVFIRSGSCEAALDTILITIIGQEDVDGKPGTSVNPAIIRRFIILRLQNLVISILSNPAVPPRSVTIKYESLVGGEKHELMPDCVHLRLSIRTFEESIRVKLLDSVRFIVEAECHVAGAPQKPLITQTQKSPLLTSDPATAGVIRNIFDQYFEGRDIIKTRKETGIDDSPNLFLPRRSRYCIWFLGSTNGEKHYHAKKNGQFRMIGDVFTGRFAPDAAPTLKAGTETFSLAALTFLTYADVEHASEDTRRR